MYQGEKRKQHGVVLAACVLFLYVVGECVLTSAFAVEKTRVVVLTDISNEPDDEESLVRYLVYSNEFDTEAIIATTSTWLREGTREDIIRHQIDAFGQVRGNLIKHADGYPQFDELLAVTSTGQGGFGMDDVGFGKSTKGSNLIIEVVDKPDDRPVWITVWGGANTLAQALWDVKYSRSPEELREFLSKIRVYTISDQDNAGRWIRITFPELFYIVSPSNLDWVEYYQATWTGISGDHHYKNGPGHFFELVDNPWLFENIRENHGPLGELYPYAEYIMEGDTPSFLGLINNGLGSHISPTYGGWGGRYKLMRSYAETRPIWTNSRDTVTADDGSVHTTAQATIWRWRDAYQYDFAARMDWCVASRYEDANHNPKAVLNGSTGKEVVNLTAHAGESVSLSASGSNDPDGNSIECSWFQYAEAGTFNGKIDLANLTGQETGFVAPTVEEKQTVHVILTVKDDGNPNLSSYRRAVINIVP